MLSEMTRGVQHVQIADRPLARGIQFQVVTKRRARSLPADAHFVDLVGSNLGEIKAGLDRKAGKAGVVLYATDAFFGNREKQFAIAHQAGGGIVHLRIVETECDHYGVCPCCR